MFQQTDFNFVHKYFVAEKQESLLFLGVGIVALILSAVFFFGFKTNPSFYKGAAIPLLVIGLIQMVVGYTVYARSDQQRIDVAYQLGLDKKGFATTQEIPRMEKVMKSFVVYRYVEIALAIAGIVLIVLFRNQTDKSFWLGLGITLTIQSLLMLGADYFAEKRGHVYFRELKNQISQP
jgi:hypothetical protein